MEPREERGILLAATKQIHQTAIAGLYPLRAARAFMRYGISPKPTPNALAPTMRPSPELQTHIRRDLRHAARTKGGRKHNGDRDHGFCTP